jgi:hypothetical protein
MDTATHVTAAQQASAERTWHAWTTSLPGKTAAPLSYVRLVMSCLRESVERIINLESWRSGFESRLNAKEVEIVQLKHALAELQAKMVTGFQISAWGWKYQPGARYKPGELTQKNGLWCCLRETTAQPGSDPASWKLLVHRSKVGNDDDR